MRVVGIDLRKQVLTIGKEQVDLRLETKDLQRHFYEAYTKLDEKDRYIASLEILVDAYVSRALPACLSFLVPSREDLQKQAGDGKC